MTDGVIWKQLVQFSIPLAIGLLFQQLYNTVDAVVVGRFVSKQALAAVGSTGSIINMLVGLCAGLSTGASVVISQAFGTHDDKALHDSVHTTILLTFIMGVVTTALGILIVPPMLRLMDTPADVYQSANTYLTIYFAGVMGLLVYNMGSGILRAVGDSLHPLYFLIFSALMNIAGDLLFVLVFHMGVAGVAYATIISQFLSAILVLWTLGRTDAPYAVHMKELAMDRAMLKRIFLIGAPSALQQAITAFSNVFVQGYINAFGSNCMAGWSSYNKLDVFILIPVQSISMASTTFVGQCYGAGKLRRAHDGVKSAMWISLVVTAVCSALLIFFEKPMLSLFNTDPEVIRYGSLFISFIGPFYVTICFNQIYAGALRGVGKAVTPTVIMLCSFVAFRQIYLFVFRQLGMGFVPVALAYPVGWVLCSLLMIIFYRRSDLCRLPDDAPQPAVTHA